jgi:hypothetical protein
LTDEPEVNTIPALKQEAEHASGARRTRTAVPAAALKDEAPSCRPFTYEDVGVAEDEGAPLRRCGEDAACDEPNVEMVRVEGIVRELIVTCSCGRKTAVRIDYGDGS